MALLSGARYRIRYVRHHRRWFNHYFTHLVDPENFLGKQVTEYYWGVTSPLGLKIGNLKPVLVVPPERKERANAALREAQVPLDKPLVAVHPFSRWGHKEWPIDRFASLVERIRAKYDCGVVITGSPEERPRAEELIQRCKTDAYNLAGKTSLGELAGVLQLCRFVLGVDTAAIHMAAGVGTPTLTIYGPSDPSIWKPLGDRHHVVAKDLPCVPCMRHDCKKGDGSRCLEDLTTDEVWKKADVLLSSYLRGDGSPLDEHGKGKMRRA